MANRFADTMIDGRYRVDQLLGRGTMGLVMRARDVALARPVAIKVLQAPSNDSMVAHFYREGRTLAQLRHNHVVQVYAIGEHEGRPYLAMEHVAGRSLETIIESALANGGTVPFNRAVDIVRRVAEGLSSVHMRGLVHRDVKPSNVMIEDGTERPVLVDFGLAVRPSELDPKASVTGGTPCYMAPEQARDPAAVGACSDIYSLACTAFELFTGRTVFAAYDLMGMLDAHANETPPLLSSLRPELFPLDEVLGRALSKSPTERYPTCKTFIEAFDAAVAQVQLGGSAMRSQPPIATEAAQNRCFEPVKAVVLQRADGLRRNVERALASALGGPREMIEIASVESEFELMGSLKRSRPDLVVIDDEKTSGRTEQLVVMLRELASPSALEVIVLLREDAARRTRLARLGVLAVPKPVNLHVLKSAISRAGRKLADRRSSAQRRFLVDGLEALETKPDLEALVEIKGTLVSATSC